MNYDEVMAKLAVAGNDLDEATCERLLIDIERGIHATPNRTRHAMNNALIAIAGGSEPLRERALEAAAGIGHVQVDHGETGCFTPDARGYIARRWERREATRRTPRPETGTR